jgi:hypothetical protein
MGTFLAPPDAGLDEARKLTRVQVLVALEHYEKLTDDEFTDLYNDINAEATRRNGERA